METLHSPQPEINIDAPKVVRVIGPDGHIFSVEVGTPSVADAQPQNLNEQIDVASPLTATEALVPPVVETTEQLQPIESIDGSAMMASLIAGGVLRWRSRRDAKSLRREADLDAHSESARATVNQHNTVPVYNPLKGFGKTHRTSKIPAGGLTMAKPAPVEVTNARTRTQDRAALRSNLREDAINKRVGDADKYIDLYGPVILDKKALKAELKSGRYSYSEKKGMKQAGRTARKLYRSSGRIHDRLSRQASGNDLHGKKIKATQKITRS